MLRAPEGVGRERRDILAGTLTIGRGTDCDWVLPDPEKILSKRHCRIEAQGDGWLVTDSSANGTLLNGSALENDLPHRLRHHDRLTLGGYEIEVMVEGEAMAADEAPTRFGNHLDVPDAMRLTGDPFPADEGDAVEAARPSIGLPLDFDVLADDSRIPERPFTASDHTPAIHGHFEPPRPMRDLLPEDWDLDGDPEPPPRQPAPTPEPTFASPGVPRLEPAGDATPPDRPVTDPAWGFDGYSAFLGGTGVSGAPPADPMAALHDLGVAFRTMVSGLRQGMIARASVKSEFRIGQTMIRAAGNNPLKFSADDDDALMALLGTGRAGTMGAAQAVGEALRDIRLHELAVAAALQSAARDLLAEVAPATVTRGLREGTLDDLLGRRKQAAWDAYVERHAAVLQALSDEFDSVFGRAFARAYEAALAEVAAQDDDGGASPDPSSRRLAPRGRPT